MSKLFDICRKTERNYLEQCTNSVAFSAYLIDAKNHALCNRQNVGAAQARSKAANA